MLSVHFQGHPSGMCGCKSVHVCAMYHGMSLYWPIYYALCCALFALYALLLQLPPTTEPMYKEARLITISGSTRVLVTSGFLSYGPIEFLKMFL